jgi:predicted extracellular nuclease
MKKLISLLVFVLSVNTMAAMQITEWMYKGTNGEFIEFTNVGTTALNLTGWSYADSSAKAGDVSLSAFGTIAPGESVILTETAASTFRAAWNLGSSIKIIGGNAKDNLGSADAINIYNASGVLVDSLTYGSTPKTENKSCTIPQADFNLTNASTGWSLSSVGDAFGSWKSSGNDIGNPGYNAYNIPEPATIFILATAAAILRFRKR